MFIVLWLSLTLRVVTPRGEKKSKLVEKGMVRMIMANYSGLRGSVWQPANRGLCGL